MHLAGKQSAFVWVTIEVALYTPRLHNFELWALRGRATGTGRVFGSKDVTSPVALLGSVP